MDLKNEQSQFVEPKEETSINGNESSESSKVIAALFAVADAKSTLTSIQRCMTDLAHLQNSRRKQVEAATRYLAMEHWLEVERRTHQEELRQINQDMNQLDDFTQSLRAQCAQTQLELDRDSGEVNAKIAQLENEGTLEEKVEVKTAMGSQITATLSPASLSSDQQPISGNAVNPLHVHLFLALVHKLLVQQQQNAQQSSSTMPLVTTAASSNSRMALPGPMIPIIPNPQQAKMKACQHCDKSIHRNAPTCPFCKKKITSKAAKRARK